MKRKIKQIKKSSIKYISIFIACNILLQSVYQPALFADNGPTSPDISTFSSPDSNNLVDHFTGTFNYSLPIINIPGPGGGYSMALNYNSNLSPEQSATWVGYGWSLSPGSITRSERGFPDDVKEGSITYYNQVPDEKTISVTAETSALTSFEAFGIKLDWAQYAGIEGEMTKSLTYSSQYGFQFTSGFYSGFNIAGTDLGINLNDGDASFVFNPSLTGLLGNIAAYTAQKSNNANVIMASGLSKRLLLSKGSNRLNNHFLNNPGIMSMPTVNRPMKTTTYSGAIEVEVDPASIPVGINSGLSGSYSVHSSEKELALKYHGFIYQGYAEDEDIMDYFSENDNYYKSRNKFLPIPFSANDVFSASAQGLGGQFKFYHKNAGHYRPNYVTQTRDNNNIGTYQIRTGVTSGIGYDPDIISAIDTYTDIIETMIGILPNNVEKLVSDIISTSLLDGLTEDIDDVCNNTISMGGWNNDELTAFGTGQNDVFAKFIGDPAAQIDFGNKNAQKYTLVQESDAGYFKKDYSPQKNSNHISDSIEQPATSQFIGHHTNEEMTKNIAGVNYKMYARSESTEKWLNRSDESIAEQVGEFSIINNNGLVYNYSLPVYIKNKKQLIYNVPSDHSTDSIEANYIVYKNYESDNDYEKKLGQINNEKYAGQWLLTELLSSNYIDRQLDGPSYDDFGSYVKFTYDKMHGDNSNSNEWYHFRTPYTGYYYDKGSFSDSKDNTACASGGYKEMYFLKRIDTKTHSAIFYTSSRQDDYDAAEDMEAGKNENAIGNNTSQKLDSVYVYSKSEDGSDQHLLQRTYFEYDYSLSAGFPSNESGEGKLTLKKVWTENENVRNAVIYPYEFVYTYPGNNTYPSMFNELDNYGGFSLSEQNPAYSNLTSDAWGYYQYDGIDRKANYCSNLNQNPDASFDPASWSLKQIKLPQGGEIHIQYEINEYQYVQNKPAMALVQLKKTSFDKYEGDLGDKLVLDLNSLGIDTSQYDDVANQIRELFIDDEEKTFYKFLYKLREDGDVNTDACDMEFIEGYLNVTEVGRQEDGSVYVMLGLTEEELATNDYTENMNDLNTWLSDIHDDYYNSPRQVCLDFYDKNRSGRIPQGNDCASYDFESMVDISSTGDNITSAMYQLYDYVTDETANYEEDGVCMYLDEEHSYLRIPLPKPKLGGGTRVKRILTSGKRLSGEKVLYGKEFIYETVDGTCSGVAANEPNELKGENPLINAIVSTDDQDMKEKILSGLDMDELEGPIGSSVLPGPSVAYSRVVEKNIYNGITSPGFQVYEFYTTLDFPSDTTIVIEQNGREEAIAGAEWTGIERKTEENSVVNTLLNFHIYEYEWATQGYAFATNDMNGKQRSFATYGGDYSYFGDDDRVYLSSKTDYDYFLPGEKLRIIDENGEETEGIPGMETDMVGETRRVEDIDFRLYINFDMSVGIWAFIPLPYFTPIPYFNKTSKILSSHVLNKTTFYPCHIRQIRKMQDGIVTNVENKVFDAVTGESVVIATSDGYHNLYINGSTHNGNYVSYQIPAYRYYNEMGIKSNAEQMTFGTENGDTIYLTNAIQDESNNWYLSVVNTGDYCSIANAFAPGDLIKVKTQGDTEFIFQVTEINGSNIRVGYTTPFAYSTSSANLTNDLYKNVEVEILKSGKSNQLISKIGNYTVYGGEAEIEEQAASQDIREKLNCLAKTFNYMMEQLRSSEESSMDISMNLSNYCDNSIDGCSGLMGIEIEYENECLSFTDLKNKGWKVGLSKQHYGEGETEGFANLKLYKLENEIFEMRGLNANGQFYADDQKGEIYFSSQEDGCERYKMDLKFCNLAASYSIDNVVSASAVVMNDDWDMNDNIKDSYDLSDAGYANAYEVGLKGNWYPESDYLYKDDISNIFTSSNARTYNTGLIENFSLFNWDDTEENENKWINPEVIEEIDPYGNILVTENILGIKNITKYGYDKTLPYLWAVYANYPSVLFESFENDYNTLTNNFEFEDAYSIIDTVDNGMMSVIETGQTGMTITTEYAHSGKQALMLEMITTDNKQLKGEHDLILKTINITDQIRENGIQVKIWVRVEDTDMDPEISLNVDKGNGEYFESDFEVVASTGEWTLYETSLKKGWFSTYTGANDLEWYIQFRNDAGSSVIIDDLRFQPMDAEMKCAVYDNDTKQLMAEFNSEHFATYYQYNKEGKLLRKLFETTEGVKTLKETQYNIPGSER
jgi:hypothetical protein